MIQYQNNKSKYVSSLALMIALALIFSYVEAIIPYNPGIPGIKLGIANVVTVFALYKFSAKTAVTVNFTRILLAGLLFNGFFGAIYSLCGAFLSLLGMIILKRAKCFSITCVSIFGGVLHNMGQLIIAGLIIWDDKVFYYSPVLIFSGIFSGLGIGIITHLLLERLGDSDIEF